MSETHSWLERYENNHQDLTWPLIYWAAVPMVVVGAVGVLWNLPVPEEFYAISPLLNWGSAFLMASAVYYFIISLPLAIGLLPFVLGIAFIQQWLQASGFSPMRVAIGFTIAGIIGLWLGHRNRSGIDALRHLVEDLQTIMIGPAWLLSVIYRRLRIPY
ncbi:MAG: DUF962 domain-containing protein [Woeseiaceae bacterium]|nr:DUF962 domain-containing protein [Woeseiaceae bacterium]